MALALVGRCRGLRRPVFGVMSKISRSSQNDLGQGPAFSGLGMDPKQMDVRGAGPPLLPTAKVPWPMLRMAVLDPNHPDQTC